MKHLLKKVIQKTIAIGRRDVDLEVLAHLNDIKSLHHLPNLDLGFLPWTNFAIRPSSLAMVLNEVVIRGRKIVLECGVGISTLHMLSDKLHSDVRLIGVDHNLEWIQAIESYLNAMGVDKERYCFIHAPLTSISTPAHEGVWYDCAILHDQIHGYLDGEKVDVLLVDGPTTGTCPMVRYPALGELNKYFGESFSVFLDDIHREDEQKIVRRWADEFNLAATFHPEAGNIALLRPIADNGFGSIRI